MTLSKIYLFLFLCVLPHIVLGQHLDPKFSNPLDIPAIGINKVLCLKNGNTVLLHFEPDKPVILKVYDSLRQEIASKQHFCLYLDIYTIKDAAYKGLFEVNGEVVLFAEQPYMNKRRLIRLRFNGNDGTLIEEKIVGQSKNIFTTNFMVMNCKGSETYAVLFCTSVPRFPDSHFYIACYNNLHQVIKKVPIEFDFKCNSYTIVNTEMQQNGVSVCIYYSKARKGRRNGADTGYNNLTMYIIPKDSLEARTQKIVVSALLKPNYAVYTYNSFAKSINILALMSDVVAYKQGNAYKHGSITENVFIKLDEQDMSLDYNWMKNRMVSENLYGKANPKFRYDGYPIKMTTNQYGLTTIFSQACTFSLAGDGVFKEDNYYTYFGNIGITQLDDDGNELWGAAIPIKQEYPAIYRMYALSRKTHNLTGTAPGVYERQFISFNGYCHNKNVYVICNDYDKNFNSNANKPGETVIKYDNTNTCYYKFDRNRQLAKQYLFGTPQQNEYNACFIESADFDEQRGIYTTLVQRISNGNKSLHMAWVQLH